MIETVAHACLSGEVDYDRRLVFGKHLVYQSLVSQISADENMLYRGFFGCLFDQGESVLLELRVVVVVHRVE